MRLKRFVKWAEWNVTTVLCLPDDKSDSRGVVDGKFPQCFLQSHKMDFSLIFPYVFASVSFLCPVSWVICLHLILSWFSARFHFHFYRFGIFLFSLQIITSRFKPWADLSSFSSSSQVTRPDRPEANLTETRPCISLEGWCVQGQSGINLPLHKGFNLFSCPLPLWVDIYAARTQKCVPSLQVVSLEECTA